MDLIYIILPLALVLATFALVAFIWAARSGQFDDLETPGRRVLFDDVPARESQLAIKNEQVGELPEGPDGARN